MRPTAFLLALVAGAWALSVGAQPVGVGTTMAPLRLADQHDVPWELEASLRLLVVTHDMDGGAIVRDVLGDMQQTMLDTHRVAYVADIAGMPALVSKLMAVPRMRKRPYRVILDRDGMATRGIPAAEGKVTVVRLDAMRVTGIEQLGTAEALRAAVVP